MGRKAKQKSISQKILPLQLDWILSDCFVPHLMQLREMVSPSQVMQPRQHKTSYEVFVFLPVYKTKLFTHVSPFLGEWVLFKLPVHKFTHM